MRTRLCLLAVGVFCTVVAMAATGSADSALGRVAATSTKSKSAPRCVVPKGWKLVDVDAQAVVVKRVVGHGEYALTDLWAYRYCLRRTGRFLPLLRDVETDSPIEWWKHGSVVLAGGYVAYQTTHMRGPMGEATCSLTVTSYSLRARKGTVVWHAFWCWNTTVAQVRVNARGFAAWRETAATWQDESMADVSCPSSSLCVAVDLEGNVLTAIQPAAGRDAWTYTLQSNGWTDTETQYKVISCSTINFCLTVGSGGSQRSSNPTQGAGAWFGSRPPLPKVSGLSCASSLLCVAVGGNTIATSTNPARDSIAWSQTTLPEAQSLAAVSCPSERLCVTVDRSGQIFTSTNPTGGASAWMPMLTSPSTSLTGVSCPSTSLCLAVGDSGLVVTSSDPANGAGAWRPVSLNLALSLGHVSCAPGPLCVAAGASGIATSTNPTGDASAWMAQAGTTDMHFSGLSCPSNVLCVATTSTGYIATSTNPAAGAAAWNFQLVAPPCPSRPGACGRPQQLYAYDSQGTRLLDGTPPGAHTLTNLQFNGNLLTWTRDGSPRQAQLG